MAPGSRGPRLGGSPPRHGRRRAAPSPARSPSRRPSSPGWPGRGRPASLRCGPRARSPRPGPAWPRRPTSSSPASCSSMARSSRPISSTSRWPAAGPSGWAARSATPAPAGTLRAGSVPTTAIRSPLRLALHRLHVVEHEQERGLHRRDQHRQPTQRPRAVDRSLGQQRLPGAPDRPARSARARPSGSRAGRRVRRRGGPARARSRAAGSDRPTARAGSSCRTRPERPPR